MSALRSCTRRALPVQVNTAAMRATCSARTDVAAGLAGESPSGAQWARGDHAVIEHADAALAAWLATLEPRIDVAFEAPDARPAKRPIATLSIRSIRERTQQRDNEVRDVRDGAGRVVERQRSTRFFDVDYVCSVAAAEPIGAHRALGSIIQLLVDHEQIPTEFVPSELRQLGHPIDAQLVSGGPAVGAAVVIQVVVPVRPTAERTIAPPAEELQLDMMPPPRPRQTAVATPLAERVAAPADAVAELAAKRWTRVRRRELIVDRDE